MLEICFNTAATEWTMLKILPKSTMFSIFGRYCCISVDNIFYIVYTGAAVSSKYWRILLACCNCGNNVDNVSNIWQILLFKRGYVQTTVNHRVHPVHTGAKNLQIVVRQYRMKKMIVQGTMVHSDVWFLTLLLRIIGSSSGIIRHQSSSVKIFHFHFLYLLALTLIYWKSGLLDI